MQQLNKSLASFFNQTACLGDVVAFMAKFLDFESFKAASKKVGA